MTPQAPDSLLSLSTVMRMMSVRSRTTIHNYLRQNPDFPRPCKIAGSRGRVKFKASEVSLFIESLKAGD